MIRELGQWIENKTSTWTLPLAVGQNLFIGYLPVDAVGVIVPERCAVLLDRVGGAVIPDIPNRIDQPIQVWNRAKNYDEAREDAWSLFKLLHVQTWFTLPTPFGEAWEVLILDAMSGPFCIANPNEKGYFEFSGNYMFRMRIPQSGEY